MQLTSICFATHRGIWLNSHGHNAREPEIKRASEMKMLPVLVELHIQGTQLIHSHKWVSLSSSSAGVMHVIIAIPGSHEQRWCDHLLSTFRNVRFLAFTTYDHWDLECNLQTIVRHACRVALSLHTALSCPHVASMQTPSLFLPTEGVIAETLLFPAHMGRSFGIFLFLPYIACFLLLFVAYLCPDTGVMWNAHVCSLNRALMHTRFSCTLRAVNAVRFKNIRVESVLHIGGHFVLYLLAFQTGCKDGNTLKVLPWELKQ